jgi:hypothetical protein
VAECQAGPPPSLGRTQLFNLIHQPDEQGGVLTVSAVRVADLRHRDRERAAAFSLSSEFGLAGARRGGDRTGDVEVDPTSLAEVVNQVGKLKAAMLKNFFLGPDG